MATLWTRLAAGTVITLAIVSQAQAADKITVFAAASLTNALQDITAAYIKKEHVQVVGSYASSSTLARQIEAGAPADIFISADQKWMNYAQDKNAVAKPTRITLLTNSLVLVAPNASAQQPFAISEKTDWKSLLKGGRLAVGDPDHVPAGIYAKEALQKLGSWDTVALQLAPADDVRGALVLVERNESPLGVVYGSDAFASKALKVVATFPENSHQKVEYPMAIVAGHENPAVTGFYNYLKGPEAAVVFKRYGFTLAQ